jgi:hypothetical protein
MDKINSTGSRTILRKNRVLGKIMDLKKSDYKVINTWIKTSKWEELFIHKRKDYEIQEVETTINREPFELENWIECEFILWEKEYVVFSKNILLDVYPNIRLAKSLINSCLERNIDFSKDKLDRKTLEKVK